MCCIATCARTPSKRTQRSSARTCTARACALRRVAAQVGALLQRPVPDSAWAVRLQGLDLLRQMLRYPPHERISAMDALQHPYFADLRSYHPGTRLPIAAQYQ